ncbi:uncharacterized protein B0T23DRAFT_414160 [Neurospora hispaniola]|uniref:Uncharacterized protein n=1 Tax=Neurospora hispaniola TaxID=588809 RepID=A0AAJ0I3Y1_9PEZI|nr:hypothetical protein B0T23DRAFT_414160 [Neurospora hispaniola]
MSRPLPIWRCLSQRWDKQKETCLEATPHDAVHGNVWRAGLPLYIRPYEDSELVVRLIVRLRLCTPFLSNTGPGVDCLHVSGHDSEIPETVGASV